MKNGIRVAWTRAMGRFFWAMSPPRGFLMQPSVRIFPFLKKGQQLPLTSTPQRFRRGSKVENGIR